MQHWALKPLASHAAIDVGRIASLLQSVIDVSHTRLAAALLNAIPREIRIELCSIYAFDESARVSLVSQTDHHSCCRNLSGVSMRYVRHYFRVDRVRDIMNMERSPRSFGSQILLHRQSGVDISHDGYRHIYDDLGLAERLSLVFPYDGLRWLSANFYRLKDVGSFGADDIAQIEAYARFIAQIVHLYYTNQRYEYRLGEVLLHQLRHRFPGLTVRESDLLRGMLEGCSTPEIAARMGIQPASVYTYQKRLYRKMGISGQRELIALALDSGRRRM